MTRERRTNRARRRSSRVFFQLTASAARTMKVPVAAVVKMPSTFSLRTAPLCSPIASPQTARRMGTAPALGWPLFANQIATKPRSASSETLRVNVVRGDHMTPLFCSPEIMVARKMPTAKAAIDARTDTRRGCGLPAIFIPRNATFPVMNAVKTFPNPRKLIESIAPDENVRASRSRLRTPSWLTWRSLLLLRDTALRVQILDMAALSACCRIDDAVDQCRFPRRQGFGKGLGETLRVGDMMTSAPESLNELVVARVFVENGS